MKIKLILLAISLLAVLVVVAVPAEAIQPVGKGFDEFGYNYQAMIFVGVLDGADRNWDGTYQGDPTQADWHLTMKWSKGWDDARFHNGAWTPDAWLVETLVSPDGVYYEHYLIVWIGGSGADGSPTGDGGVRIWGAFEITLAVGNSPYLFPTGGCHAQPVGVGYDRV